MTKTHFADFRGSIRGLSARGSELIFTLEHPEGQPTEVFLYDLDKGSASTTPLKGQATAQVLGKGDLWVGRTADSEHRLLKGKPGKKLKAVGEPFDRPVTALALTSQGVAALSGSEILFLDEKGAAKARFDLGDRGTAVATDPAGEWAVAGTRRGTMSIFQLVDGAFREIRQARLHDGAITALAFLPDELRVLSAGTDNRLLLSFVRGELDTEDRGGSQSHDRDITALIIAQNLAVSSDPESDKPEADGPPSRIFTAGLDSAIKSWPLSRSGSQRPATFTTGVVQTDHLAIVTIDGKSHVAAAGRDATIRVFSLDFQGRLVDHVITLRDAYAEGEGQLQGQKPAERKKAIQKLAGFGDARSLEILATHVFNEDDHKLTVEAVRKLSSVPHPRTAGHLERIFAHHAEDVRLAALDGWLKLADDDDRTPLNKALDAGHTNLGLRAVEVLLKRGTDADAARLREALNHSDQKVRFAALHALEKHAPKTPESTLAGLTSRHGDLQRRALTRLYQRGLLDDPIVQAHLRKATESYDEPVRHKAMHVLLHARPNLVKALRFLDEDFHRRVVDLEEEDLPDEKKSKKLPKAMKFLAKKLKPEDFRPLLQLMGSNYTDVCLFGATGLATLGDERALGTLFLLLHSGTSGDQRRQVCEAIARLDDPRAIDRMRALLKDTAPEVRDAAFSALAELQKDHPFEVVRAAFTTFEVDVHHRALKLLLDTLRDSGAALTDEAEALLLAAINDPDKGLRHEAFKAILHMEIGGSHLSALKFLSRSSHGDIRFEVIQETKTHPDDMEYRKLLLESLDDPDRENQKEAFQFARDKWTTEEQEDLFKWALSSKRRAMRIQAVRELVNETEESLRALLTEGLDDEESSVRLEAVDALLRMDNTELLRQALKSGFEDVRAASAAALAALGEEEALEPLLAAVSRWDQAYRKATSEPSETDQQKLDALRVQVVSALRGLALLQSPEAFEPVSALFEGDDAQVRQAAARALPWISTGDHLDRLEELLRDADGTVRSQAAMALAAHGDDRGTAQIFSDGDEFTQLQGAFLLRHHSQERFFGFANRYGYRSRCALAMILLLELADHGGLPERMVALLTAQQPGDRLIAAQGIETYGDLPAFREFVTGVLNSFDKELELTEEEVQDLARALSSSQIGCSLSATILCDDLTSRYPKRFRRRWEILRDRWASELAADVPEKPDLTNRVASAWKQLGKKVKALVVEPSNFEEALDHLAFGAYVGLSREPGYSASLARAAAVSGLYRVVQRRPEFKDDAIAVLFGAFLDNHMDVRTRAFETLRRLDVDPERLANEALLSDYNDLSTRGLQLISERDDGEERLKALLLGSDRGLHTGAANVLVSMIGEVETYRIGLRSADQYFRSTSVRNLARRYAVDEEAAGILRDALNSPFDDVRHLAAELLAGRKDDVAFDTLVAMVESSDAGIQTRGVNALTTLEHDQASATLISRVDDDSDGSAQLSAIFDALQRFSPDEVGDALMRWLEEDLHESYASSAAVNLTGYQQYQWVSDEQVTPAWEEDLKPLYPEFFRDLLSLAYRLASVELLNSLVPLAKWPPTDEALDAALAPLLRFSDEGIRHRAVEIVGWRLLHRDGPTDGLQALVSAGDVLDQFHAAEYLALSGDDTGLPVLRTSMVTMDAYDLRRRAVLALGHLADPSTLDSLLEIALDPEHEQRDAACEAIGHMSSSERAAEIFEILSTNALDDDYTLSQSSLRGLRWFGTPRALDVIRQVAADIDGQYWKVEVAVELLRHDDGSRETLGNILRQNASSYIAAKAMDSLRHLYGPDSLEPDYLFAQAQATYIDGTDKVLERLREDGEPGRLLELLPKIHPNNEYTYVAPITTTLLSRDPLPVKEAAQGLSSDDRHVGAVSARIIGRAGGDAAGHKKAVAAALNAVHESYEAAFEDRQRGRAGAYDRLLDQAQRYRWTLWAAGRLEVGQKAFLRACDVEENEFSRPMLREAITWLGADFMGDAGREKLRELMGAPEPWRRSFAAAEWLRITPDAAAQIADTPTDSLVAQRLSQGDPETIKKPMQSLVNHQDYRGMALPKLAEIGDLQGLLITLRDEQNDEITRLGAIDAIAQIPDPEVAKEAHDELAAFGADESQDEALRKAAWRARRRVQRSLNRHGGTRV